MAIGNATSRDQLDRLLDVGRRATRYWWLMALIAVVGGSLSVAFAITRPHEFQSETVLLYRETISTSMLSGHDTEEGHNALSSRYKEMLLSRTNLAKVVEEYGLFPEVVADRGSVAAADLLRLHIGFRDKGSGTFRITYQGSSPDEVQRVTARLAKLLIDEDNRIRREQANVTKQFLDEEKGRATEALRAQEKEMASFLTLHPEFAEEDAGGSGASIRASVKKGTPAPSGGDSTLLALVRQRNRIQARLEDPDKPATVIKPTGVRSPERISAESDLRAANQDLSRAQSELTEKQQQFTEKHPDVVAAKNRFAEAQARVRRAEAALAGVKDEDVIVAPLPIDRGALQAELAKVEREIDAIRARKPAADGDKPAKSGLADELVNLETQWSALNGQVEEVRGRVEQLAEKAFTAEITASSEVAQASQLTIIDEAFRPTRAAGKPRQLLVMAGTFVFAGLGVALAIGLALIDDRVYRRNDLERLAIAPVMVVVPAARKQRKRG